MVDKKPTKKANKSRKKPTTSKTSTPKKRTTKRTTSKTKKKPAPKKKKAPKKADKPKVEVKKKDKPRKKVQPSGKGFGVGVSKLDVALIILGLRKQIIKRIKDGAITVGEACEVLSYMFERLGKKSNHQIFRTFCFAQSKSFLDIVPIMNNWLRNTEGGIDMAKIQLGITLGEIMGMIPDLISEAWGAYNDDKKITADEGVVLAAVIMEQMGAAADHPEVKAFFDSQGAALRDLAPLLEGVEDEPVVEEGGDS